MNANRHLFFLVAAILSLHINIQGQEQGTLVYGLVVDNSSSLREQIPEVVEVGHLIVSSNRPGDKTFLVRFVGHEITSKIGCSSG